MEELILSIEEFNDDGEGGYKVTTTRQTITLAIDMERCCCEETGYFMSEDDLQRFIGARLLDVTVTDTALQTVQVPDVWEGDVLFVNLETDRGVLQFVAYNIHNGYYGHRARVECEQVQYEKVL